MAIATLGAVGKFEVKGLRSSRSEIDRDGPELRFLWVVEALWAAYEEVAKFVEAQDAVGVLCDADANAFADWAGIANG